MFGVLFRKPPEISKNRRARQAEGFPGFPGWSGCFQTFWTRSRRRRKTELASEGASCTASGRHSHQLITIPASLLPRAWPLAFQGPITGSACSTPADQKNNVRLQSFRRIIPNFSSSTLESISLASSRLPNRKQPPCLLSTSTTIIPRPRLPSRPRSIPSRASERAFPTSSAELCIRQLRRLHQSTSGASPAGSHTRCREIQNTKQSR